MTPVVITWAAVDGSPRTENGVTRDLCLEGMCVVSDDSPPMFTQVHCEVLLPPVESGGKLGKRLGLQSVGRVVWCEAHGGGFGISARDSVLVET